MTPLKKGDEVFVKSLSMHGTVLGGRNVVGEPEEDQFYRVQIIRYCRPSDLELIDREAEREKREAELQAKSDRLATARKKIEAGHLTPANMAEAVTALDDLWQALGHEPFLKKK
jgi:hypothetical protein